MDKPLQGIKVVELSTFVAGPVTARFLSDMGADVIKVEKNDGDAWRRTSKSYLPLRFSDDENPVFTIYNTGKRLITLNLKTPEGKEIMHKLLAEADVFVTNTRTPSLKRMGLSYEDLKEKYPRLIYAFVGGYGEKGPDANRPAYDTTTFWCRCGMIADSSVIGENGEYQPIFPPSSVGDTAAAYLLLAEINSALYQREKTGKGQLVQSTLFHVGTFTFGTMLIYNQRPFGSKMPSDRASLGQVGGTFRCKDHEWVYLAAGDPDVTRRRLFNAIGHPELADNDLFGNWRSRWARRGELNRILSGFFAEKTQDEWMQLAEEYDIPLCRIAHFADLAEDEQAWANGFLEHVDFPNGHTDTMPSSPIEMESIEEELKTVHTPLPGTDNTSVLRELGYTDEQIAALDASGVIAPVIGSTVS